MNIQIHELDLLRDEYRYSLLPEAREDFESCLKKEWREVAFSENHVTLTIYLDNDEHEVPFGTSVKLRKFLPIFLNPIPRGAYKVFRFEFKETTGGIGRKKSVPQFLTIPEAITATARHLSIKTRPYLAVQYRRRHYVPNNLVSIRLTLDSDISYWFLDKDGGTWRSLGEERICRVEGKVSDEDKTSEEWRKLETILEAHQAFPVNSKRNEGYARIGHWLIEHFAYPLVKDFRGYEIEAKLNFFHGEPGGFFGEMKEWCKELLRPFVLSPRFPFTIDSENINRYWAEEREGELVDGLKILLKGERFSVVLKSEYEVLDEEHGIVKRREVKIKSRPLADYHVVVTDWMAKTSSPSFLGELRRRRRAVWVMEPVSLRLYHISLDQCRTSNCPTPLLQVEVEYVGCLESGMNVPPEKLETTVTAEICQIVTILLRLANRKQRVLGPTTLTKFQWLAQVSS